MIYKIIKHITMHSIFLLIHTTTLILSGADSFSDGGVASWSNVRPHGLSHQHE